MVLDLFFFFFFLLRPSAGIPHTHTPHPSTLFSCSCCCTILGGLEPVLFSVGLGENGANGKTLLAKGNACYEKLVGFSFLFLSFLFFFFYFSYFSYFLFLTLLFVTKHTHIYLSSLYSLYLYMS